LLGPSGHDYKPGALANIRDRDRGVPKITRGFRGCERVSFFSKYEWSDGRVSKKTRIRGFIFFHIDQTRPDEDVPGKIGSSDHHLFLRKWAADKKQKINVCRFRKF